MYVDLEKKKVTDKNRARRYRERKKGVTMGVTQDITLPSTMGVTVQLSRNLSQEAQKVPALVLALSDPVKRERLQRVCTELKNEEFKKQNLLEDVYYGVSGVTFKTVNECLECLN